jgi:phage gpG-like protein
MFCKLRVGIVPSKPLAIRRLARHSQRTVGTYLVCSFCFLLNIRPMALKKPKLYSSLWQSCDELRGGMDASQYKDYVLVGSNSPYTRVCQWGLGPP